MLTNLIELCFHGHLLVTGGTGKVVDTPGLVEGGEHICLYDLVAHLTKVSKQLVVVGLTVGEPLPLVVAVSKERLLALSTNKVLNVPVLAEGCHHPLFYGAPACATDGDAHLVVAAEAVELIQLIGRVARSGAHLSSCSCEFLLAAGAGEVVGVVHLAPEPQGVPIYDGVALLAHVLPLTSRFYLSIAVVAEGPALILDEPKVR